MKKIHIGFHKAGSTFLQQIVFPTLPNYKGRYYTGSEDKHTDLYIGKPVKNGCENILKYYSKFDADKSLWELYHRNRNLYLNFYSDAVWAQLGLYFEKFKHYTP